MNVKNDSTWSNFDFKCSPLFDVEIKNESIYATDDVVKSDVSVTSNHSHHKLILGKGEHKPKCRREMEYIESASVTFFYSS